MIYRVNLKNRDNWIETVYVEALDMRQAESMALTEFPNHRVVGITEDIAIAIIK